jgi:hypothetical protein
MRALDQEQALQQRRHELQGRFGPEQDSEVAERCLVSYISIACIFNSTSTCNYVLQGPL